MDFLLSVQLHFTINLFKTLIEHFYDIFRKKNTPSRRVLCMVSLFQSGTFDQIILSRGAYRDQRSSSKAS